MVGCFKLFIAKQWWYYGVVVTQRVPKTCSYGAESHAINQRNVTAILNFVYNIFFVNHRAFYSEFRFILTLCVAHLVLSTPKKEAIEYLVGHNELSTRAKKIVDEYYYTRE